MRSLLTGKFATMWEINAEAGREHPVLFYGLSCAAAGLRGRGTRADLAAAGPRRLLVRRRRHRRRLFFSWGDNSFTHAYRIAALADQAAQRPAERIPAEPVDRRGVPTFVYYSHVSYLLPVLFALLGLPAIWAFKISMMPCTSS